ncbi:hypothetical protein FDG2_0144 [Candidatus Protofrankia californiensis]|uniref:Uncharacterized protein n=1 Tax=Candidatus Protofrankia californiensis TaxID=1839754 RepID=A0A1C3NSZ1_9ACTN|nr:hypothetical protein FDG2_0144 [Candidatus Protofrankia californiensis]
MRRYRGLLGLVLGSILADSTDPGASSERSEPITDWFTRHVTADALPNLHRTLPALISMGCRVEFAHELDLLIEGLRAAVTSAGVGERPVPSQTDSAVGIPPLRSPRGRRSPVTFS